MKFYLHFKIINWLLSFLHIIFLSFVTTQDLIPVLTFHLLLGLSPIVNMNAFHIRKKIHRTTAIVVNSILAIIEIVFIFFWTGSFLNTEVNFVIFGISILTEILLLGAIYFLVKLGHHSSYSTNQNLKISKAISFDE